MMIEPSNRLSVEVINKILQAFVNQSDKEIEFNASLLSKPDLRKSSYTELIRLRLVSKDWSKSVSRFYFHTIFIKDSKRANLILENWNDDLVGPQLPSPVKKLTIGQIWWKKDQSEAEDAGSESGSEPASESESESESESKSGSGSGSEPESESDESESESELKSGLGPGSDHDDTSEGGDVEEELDFKDIVKGMVDCDIPLNDDEKESMKAQLIQFEEKESMRAQLIQFEESLQGLEGKADAKISKKEEQALVSMDQVARLIESLGQNLETLNLNFITSIGASARLINAIKNLKDLKSLSISYGFGNFSSQPGTHDLKSLSRFFSAIPQLECLSLEFSSFKKINIKPPAFSNLRFLSFSYDDNARGISKITQASKNTLKIIELFSAEEDPTGLGRVFEPIKDTLEGLFTISFCAQLLDDVTDLEFPKLRVLRTQDGDDSFMDEIYWLQVPMLKNVRTIVTDFEDGDRGYWRTALKHAGKKALAKVPNFKHIIFTKNQFGREKVIDPELVKAFESHGVRCHVTDELSCDEIMELDLKLNGPMK